MDMDMATVRSQKTLAQLIKLMVLPRHVLSAPLAILLVTMLTTPAAHADCSCLCVEGNVQAVCDNSVEPRPLCGPTWCAPTPDIREPEPLVASPGKEWIYASPPETKLGDDTYEWVEVGEPEDEWN